MHRTDIAKEIIHLPHFYLSRRYQELRDILRALDIAEVRSLITDGLAEHDQVAGAETAEPWLYGPDDAGIELILWLAQVRPDGCAGLPAELWRRRVFGPGVLYRGADAATRDALLAEADASLAVLVDAFPSLAARPIEWGPHIGDQLGALMQMREWRLLNVVLRMLAWIGDEPVQHWFRKQRARVAGWESLLRLPVDAYVSEGGWELAAEETRRELTFPVACQLVDAAIAQRDITDEEAVAVMAPYDGHCRWCGRRLTALLDLNLRHPALAFLKLDGERLRLVMCEECSLWNHLYLDVDLSGGVQWSAFNAAESQGYLGEEGVMLFTPPSHRLVLGPQCASPFEVVARGDGWDVSQLGGMPGWVQDAGYPLCPECHRRMLFVGQVTPEAITDRGIDGVLYGLLCRECLHSTVIYQCT